MIGEGDGHQDFFFPENNRFSNYSVHAFYNNDKIYSSMVEFSAVIDFFIGLVLFETEFP